MPRPSAHLDVFLVPVGLADLPEHAVLIDGLAAAGLASGRAAGPRAEAVLKGGYRSVRIDRPEHPTLYANRQGGFRVACPATGQTVVPAFSKALGAWRGGGQPELAGCPACGGDHAFDALDTAPLAAVGRAAVVLVDAGSVKLTEAGQAQLTELIGPFHLIGSRR